MQPLISVIIPLYNGENYIEKCLDSIRAQNYSPLEIIIVNDDSKDSSVECIKGYGNRNDIPVRLMEAGVDRNEAEDGLVDGLEIIVIHQCNQGQGAARNTGIRYAKGEYLAFIDQDDTMNEGIFPKMVRTAREESADMVSAGYRRVTPDGRVKQEVSLQQTDWSKYRSIAPWSRLYSTEFIKKNEIMFLPVVLGEDIYFLMQAYSYEPKVAFLEDIGYNWLDNASSVSNTAHKELAEDTSLLKLYDMMEDLKHAEVLRKDKLYEYFLIKTAVWDILYTARSNSYENVLANNRRIWDWFSEHFADYKKNPYVRMMKPKGEGFMIRLIVWGYMLLKRLHLEKLFLRVVSR